MKEISMVDSPREKQSSAHLCSLHSNMILRLCLIWGNENNHTQTQGTKEGYLPRQFLLPQIPDTWGAQEMADR